MITTNEIKRLIQKIESLPHPFKFDEEEYKWLKELLKEINKQSGTAIQVGIIKSPDINL